MALTLSQAGDLIRSAWDAGRKTVTIDGVELEIRRIDHLAVIRGSDGEQKRRVESWLNASPAHGRGIVPHYNVELRAGTNTRVTDRK